MALHGNLVVDTIVGQGATPVGPALTVSGCEGSVVKELSGMPALQVAQWVARSEQQPSLLVGVGIGNVEEDRGRALQSIPAAAARSVGTGARKRARGRVEPRRPPRGRIAARL